MKLLKVDTSVLKAGALAVVGSLAMIAAVRAEWNVVTSAMMGLFGILSIRSPTPTSGATPEKDQ